MAARKPLVEGAEEGLKQLRNGIQKLRTGQGDVIERFRLMAENWAKKKRGGT